MSTTTGNRYTDGSTQRAQPLEGDEQKKKKKNRPGQPKEKIDSVANVIANNPDLPNWLKVNTPGFSNTSTTDDNDKKNKNKKKKKQLVHEINHSFTPQDNPFGLAETSSFTVLFPAYREPYLKQVIPIVQAVLKNSPFFVDVQLDLKGGKMIVSTTDKTFDPFIIIKARDTCQLMSRGISFEQAKRVLDDGVFSDVVKIGNFVKDVERFKRRRQRLLGPNGATLKALELLTGCYIFIQGKTVSIIGDIKGLKLAKQVVEDCMQNVHPVYHIKELMIRRELEKKPELQNEDWSKYLPQFKKNVQSKRKPKKKKIEKKKKEYTPFPNPVERSKVDLQLESGEYFLSEDQKKNKHMKQVMEKSTENSIKNQEKKKDKYIAPEDKEKAEKKKKKVSSDKPASSASEDVHTLAKKVKEQHENMEKKRKASEISKGVSADEFVHKKKKRKTA